MYQWLCKGFIENAGCKVAIETTSVMLCPFLDTDIASFLLLMSFKIVGSPEGHQDDLRTGSYV